MKAGFARVDMTPPLGTHLYGYYEVRPADGIITPLYINTVVFDDGEKKAALITLDLEGMHRSNNKVVRDAVAEATGIDPEAIFICCTHTHLGPTVGDMTDKESCAPYDLILVDKIRDSVLLAIKDLAEARGFIGRTTAEGLSFVRIFYMPDGSTKTNPRLGTVVDSPVGEADDELQLLRLTREGKPDIAMVNFATHADVIGGDRALSKRISAEYPGFFRMSLEKALSDEADGKGAHAIFFNGTEGDVVHADRFDEETHTIKAYPFGLEHAKHMGRKLAGCALKIYTHAKEIELSKLSFCMRPVPVTVRKGTPDELVIAKEMFAYYLEHGAKAVSALDYPFDIVTANRIQRLEKWPDKTDLYISALCLGGAIFIGFPGEPFNEIGVGTRKGSPFDMTFTCCLTNGSEGYYPPKKFYSLGGYEAKAARFEEGAAEKLMDNAISITKEFYESSN